MVFKDDWDSLEYFDSGEWQVVQEKLDDEPYYNPGRDKLFQSFKETPYSTVRVAIIGQDPYPDSRFCTGVAFSTPKGTKTLPATLTNIYTELFSDLAIPRANSGDLSSWCRQGVLLWNAYPSCRTGQAASHHWDEWTYLTKEVIERLSNRGGIVFAFLGSMAQGFSKYVLEDNNDVICVSHPSPLGARAGARPFIGSRLFSTINSFLVQHYHHEPIDWRIPNEKTARS